uniref:Penicillin-insensitive murein endopeptidase n=1 Tax=Candidatus Kentrum sp. LPFa TaxID=2126335 RepID=A0A450WVU0_9GAMM|nr:MAG: Penicillin-insensitive murein endopeptidase [Candidatus Kentron sp. LPFa]
MKDLFEFVDTKDEGLVEVNSNEDELFGNLVDALSERDDEELGIREIDPEVLVAAVELPHHNQLKPEYKGMYVRYGSSCSRQHWGTKETVNMALSLAHNWWKRGNRPTMLLGDISAKNFGQTGCHSAHKNGKHLDADLSGTLPSDSGYNLDKQKKCAIICWFAIQLGARRALFSDSAVAKAVNKIAVDKGYPGRVVVRTDHDNHFHFEM